MRRFNLQVQVLLLVHLPRLTCSNRGDGRARVIDFPKQMASASTPNLLALKAAVVEARALAREKAEKAQSEANRLAQLAERPLKKPTKNHGARTTKSSTPPSPHVEPECRPDNMVQVLLRSLSQSPATTESPPKPEHKPPPKLLHNSPTPPTKFPFRRPAAAASSNASCTATAACTLPPSLP